MPPRKECSLEAFQENVRRYIHEGYPREQAIAIAYDVLRRSCLPKHLQERAKRENWTPRKIVSVAKGSEKLASLIKERMIFKELYKKAFLRTFRPQTFQKSLKAIEQKGKEWEALIQKIKKAKPLDPEKQKALRELEAWTKTRPQFSVPISFY